MRDLVKSSSEIKVFCGIDFHKNTSTLAMLDSQGREIEPVTKIQTKNLRTFLSNRKDWKIGIEATGGVNHVVDGLKADGHEVIIINPNQFRGIGIGGKKTDSRDAMALANGLRLGFAPEVYHKSKTSRELKSLLTTREQMVQTRVGFMSHIRGTLREYGEVFPVGVRSFFEEAPIRIGRIENEFLKRALENALKQIKEFERQEKEIDESIRELLSEREEVKLLKTIPGVGPVIAALFIAVVDDIERFSDSKQFASYLGLVPSVSASANTCHMGSITRSGSEMLRRNLIHGARAWLKYAPTSDRNRIWAENVKSRRGMNKATVALAHRMARIGFAILKSKKAYYCSEKKKYSPPVAA